MIWSSVLQVFLELHESKIFGFEQALCAKVNDKLRQQEQASAQEKDNAEIHVKINHQQKPNCIDDSEDIIDDYRGSPRQDNTIDVNTEQQNYGGGSLALSPSQFDPAALLIGDKMETWCHSILGDHSIYGNTQKKEREPYLNKNHLKDLTKTKKSLEPLWSREYQIPSFHSSVSTTNYKSTYASKEIVLFYLFHS